MNRQPNRNSNANVVRNLTHFASELSQKENAMNRRIATVLFALFAALVLNACAAPYPFQGTGSVTVLPKEAAPMVSGVQVNDRQQLTEYQASLTAVSLVATAPKTVKASGQQVNDRQQLAEYQASLTVYTAPARGLQINDRQALADYQATLR
jgi:hypothetical protein